MAAVPLLGSLLGALRGALLGDLLSSSPRAPGAAFIADLTSIDAGDSVQFSDRSAWAPTSWHWEKNDGSGWVDFAGTPTAQNPIETLAAGTWSVRLTATNATGSDTATKTDYVVAAAGAGPPLTNLIAEWEPGVAYEFQDAAAITPVVSAGDPVGAWVPRYGSGTAVQATSGKRPIYRSGHVECQATAGTDLQATFALNGPYTLAAAVQYRTIARKEVFDGKNLFGCILFRENDTFLTIYNGATLTTTYVPVANTPFVVVVRHTGTHISVRVNGVEVLASTPDTTVDLGGFTIGSAGNETDAFDGDFFGAAVYSGAISDADAALLETYLGALAGLTL